jgi:hypothetical protein
MGGAGSVAGAGGAGVWNASTITSLSNSGAIAGGNGGAGFFGGGFGGAGVANSGTIGSLSNRGKIVGGAGGPGNTTGAVGAGAAAVMNSGTIKTLTNSGTIRGGKGGSSISGGAGGAGVMNSGTIKTLTNSGTVSGGAGGKFGGPGGAGVLNSGAIGPLANSGVIEGGLGASGGAMGDAIYSAGQHASIGPIANSGRIIGNVVIDNQASVTVTGGSGKTFGSWTGGMITIGNGNLTFAGGATALGDDISVDGGAGTVTNMGRLRLAALQTIAGSFTQTAAGVLGLDFSGGLAGQYGALTVSKLTTLDGGLAIDLTNGFTLATGDSFDILGFANLAGGFDALALDGAACMARPMDSWTCGGDVRLNEVIHAKSLDLVVANASAAVGPAGSSPIPEPSTWTMLAMGFFGLGGLSLRRPPARRLTGPNFAASHPAAGGRHPLPLGGRGARSLFSRLR